jgi:hypothetical protein
MRKISKHRMSTNPSKTLAADKVFKLTVCEMTVLEGYAEHIGKAVAIEF